MSDYFWLAAAVIISWLVYHILPFAVCSLQPRLSSCRFFVPALSSGVQKSRHTIMLLVSRWLNKLNDRFIKAGFTDKRTMTVYLGLMLVVPPVLLVISLALGWQIFRTLLFSLAMISLVHSWISKRIRNRQRAFSVALYKIYRFLDLQQVSGLKITDSLKGLPDAVDDPSVKPILIRFAARYELTLDFDQAFNEIRASFGGSDCELMGSQLRQCLQTGETGQSLHRMEDLLFSRYFSSMQADSQKIRFHLLLTALLGILPGATLFMLPLLYQAIMAMQSVFG